MDRDGRCIHSFLVLVVTEPDSWLFQPKRWNRIGPLLMLSIATNLREWRSAVQRAIPWTLRPNHFVRAGCIVGRASTASETQWKRGNGEEPIGRDRIGTEQ